MKYDDPQLTIDEFFTYHPVMTQERQNLHELVNHHSLHIALLIKSAFDMDDPIFNKLLTDLQFIRMCINQQVTICEIKRIKQAVEQCQTKIDSDLIS